MISKEFLLKTDPSLKNRPKLLDASKCILDNKEGKCLAKMFCGTGKTTTMTNVIIHEKKQLSVIVEPSLALIRQYEDDYLNDADKPYKILFSKHKIINISSEKLSNIDSTTDPNKIKKFLKLKSNIIVLVTYQSLFVLFDCLKELKEKGELKEKAGLICYDEAHHVVSLECQKLVFETDYFEKEVFFTATPKNENGIIMYDREKPENNMCGELVYEYTYLQALNDKILNSFQVCLDMYTDNSNNSIYEAIARAILERKTSRVLSFHSGVNGESNTNVWNFVNEEEFIAVFKKVQAEEFPEIKSDYYKRITFKGMDGNTPSDVRQEMLKKLGDTPTNEIYIISSCETIGEGVDTKKANMCVFADPKSSIVKIIQNIGRIVRRNDDFPMSTVLIPCFVNMENYAEAKDDKEKRNELIMEQMRNQNGDYSPILNVLAALRQEDPQLYEDCLNYPNRNHKEKSLSEQGFEIEEDEDDEYTSNEVEEMKTERKIPLEIHTNDTIERFNEEVEDERLVRLYYDEECDVYKPIVSVNEDEDEDKDDYESDEDEDDEDDRRVINPPKKRTEGVYLSIHNNDDIQMLWSVTSELDFSKKFCSAVIECEVSYNEELWNSKHEKLILYMEEHKKTPNQHDKNKEVALLGSWVSRQNQNYRKIKKIMTNPNIRKKWEDTMQKYSEYFMSPEDIWHSTHEKSILYMEEHKKIPLASDNNQEIKSLGRWVYNQHNNYKENKQIMTNPNIRKEWEKTMEKYSNYFRNFEEIWHSTHEKVILYMKEHKKAPSASDENKEIVSLGQWTSTQKTHYNNKVGTVFTNSIIKKKWEDTMQIYLEYLGTIEDLWSLTNNKVIEYIDKHKKRPSSTDKNNEIKTLGAWVTMQLQNYKKNISIVSSNEIIKKKMGRYYAKILRIFYDA